jgi:hypothetical protein
MFIVIAHWNNSTTKQTLKTFRYFQSADLLRQINDTRFCRALLCLVRDYSAVRRLFVQLPGAVGRQNALHKENSGFAAGNLRRHISTFRDYRILFSIRNPYINGERSDVPRLQEVEQKAVGRQSNLGLGREQVNFQWNDDKIRFVLDQHA